MKSSARAALLAAPLLVGAALPGGMGAQAQMRDTPDLISVGAGWFDVQKNEPRDKTADYRLEYRFGDRAALLRFGAASLRPWVGAEATSDGAVYGLGGLLLDVALGPLVVTPSFGAGVYHDGGGKDLGSGVEFRSSIELAYRLENQMRIGFAFGHISNAGLTRRNPGAEIATIYLHIPAGWLF